MPWKPGQSGNPAGRSKSTHALTRVARKSCKAALELCAKCIADPDIKMETRLTAAGMVMDRGLGKPASVAPLVAFSDEELVQELMTRKRIRDAEEQRNQLDGDGANGKRQ